jgi:ribosomal protein S18 acetylase RimI-like enzyme
MELDIHIHRIEPFRARDVAGAVGRIYRDAHGIDDAEAQRFLSGAFAKHATWLDFRLFVATYEGIPVGFVYGYTSRPGQWWHDTIRPALEAAGHAAWQRDAVELAEIAVSPAVQGRGIGTAMLEAFLADAEGRAILLSTMANPADRAQALYRRHGFVDLVAGFLYPGATEEEAAILMGRRP